MTTKPKFDYLEHHHHRGADCPYCMRATSSAELQQMQAQASMAQHDPQAQARSEQAFYEAFLRARS